MKKKTVLNRSIGKGQYQKFHTFRPWPNAYLVQLTDENGKTLDGPAMTAYQNPGY